MLMGFSRWHSASRETVPKTKRAVKNYSRTQLLLQEQLVDIFEYAMQMEKDGENYYRRLAESTDSKGIKTIFTMLADEEVKHFNIIKNIKSQTSQQVSESAILHDTRNIFTELKQSGQRWDLDVEQKELYKKARDIEEKSRKFYFEKAQLVGEEQKQIFLKLAEEERKHYLLLENILQLVARPESWLENAEFYHSEEY
jgi:rubrerythrin